MTTKTKTENSGRSASTKTQADPAVAISKDDYSKLCLAIARGCKDPRVIQAVIAAAGSFKIDFEAEPMIWTGNKWAALHEGQRIAWNAYHRIIAIFAGWQSGKTSFGAPWLRREIHREGAGDYVVIAPNYPLLDNKAIGELKRVFCEPHWKFAGASGGGGVFTMTKAGEVAYYGAPQFVETRILCRSASNPDSIEAFTAKAIWVDEPGKIPNVTWQSIQARCLYHQGRILLTSRPYEFNWYVTDIWNRCMQCFGNPDVDPWVPRADAPKDILVVNFATNAVDNPGNQIEYARQKDLMPPWAHRMKYDGIPTRPAAQIYGSFVPKHAATDSRPSNVINFHEFFPKDKHGHGYLPSEWRIWVGADFGPIHVAFVLFAEEMEYDHQLGWREMFAPRFCAFHAYKSTVTRTAREHLRMAFKPFGEDHVLFNANGEAEEGFRITREQIVAYGGAKGETAWRESYARWGLDIMEPIITGSGSVDPQIQATWTAWQSGRLLVCDHLDEYIGEITTMARELDENDEPTEKIHDEAKYHLGAATRYVVPAMLPFGEMLPDTSGLGGMGMPGPGSAPAMGIPGLVL